MSKQYKDIQDRISNMKIQLMFDHVFFGTFLANTNLYLEKNIPTAATNGIDIYYNPDFFATLTDEELKGVLLHEVFHMVYSHCQKKRRGIREARKWNVAADYAINWEIDELDKKKIKLPKIALLDYKFKNKYVEQIYDELPDNFTGDSLDIHMDMPSDETKQQELEDRILTSHELAKKDDPGKIPAGIARAVNEIRKSRVRWEKIFHRYLGSAISKNDYSYSRFNRRFLAMDLYLPSLGTPTLGRVLFAPDCSGSIGQKELVAMTSELRKVAGLVEEVVVASWDTKVHTWERIRDLSNLEKASKFKGGGGTDIRCVFDELSSRKEEFDLIIILTDGYYGELPKKTSVKVPTIFVMTTDVTPEWGAVVKMKL